MSDYLEIIARLAAATLVGGAIGLNRNLHGKPSGVRTLALVALGSALAVMGTGNFASGLASDGNAISRAIQGVITGIGFLGAGVIVRNEGTHIQRLTTAACIWLTACIGVICGIGAWRVVLVALPLAFIVLIFGGPLERALHDWWTRPGSA
jgi:putative Mg2+ transporter-C (MgtC) family protein